MQHENEFFTFISGDFSLVFFVTLRKIIFYGFCPSVEAFQSFLELLEIWRKIPLVTRGQK
jgi:hypothetical protein